MQSVSQSEVSQDKEGEERPSHLHVDMVNGCALACSLELYELIDLNSLDPAQRRCMPRLGVDFPYWRTFVDRGTLQKIGIMSNRLGYKRKT